MKLRTFILTLVFCLVWGLLFFQRVGTSLLDGFVDEKLPGRTENLAREAKTQRQHSEALRPAAPQKHYKCNDGVDEFREFTPGDLCSAPEPEDDAVAEEPKPAPEPEDDAVAEEPKPAPEKEMAVKGGTGSTENTGVSQFSGGNAPAWGWGLAGDFEKFPECRMYDVYCPRNSDKALAATKELLDKIDSLTSVAAIYDRNAAKFDTKKEVGPDGYYGLIVWDGYLQIKKAGTYTFQVTRPETSVCQSLGLRLNNTYGCQAVYRSSNQLTVNAELKIGMNKLRFFVWTPSGEELQAAAPLICYKFQSADGEFREFTPSNLYHSVETYDW